MVRVDLRASGSAGSGRGNQPCGGPFWGRMIAPDGEDLLRAQHRDRGPAAQNIHMDYLVGMRESDLAINRPGEVGDDVTGVMRLPAPLGDLQAPGLPGRDPIAHVVFEKLADAVEVGLAPVLHRHPFDRKSERVTLVGETAAPACDLPCIERRAGMRDSIDAGPLYLGVSVPEAAEYVENLISCKPVVPAFVRNQQVHGAAARLDFSAV